jgi:Domain of unknown function (DUF4864)
MKPRWLIGCGAAGILGVGLCVGLGVLFVGGVFALTQPVVDASEQFLALLGEGKTAEAYASAAEGFRAQQDQVSFTEAVKQLGLSNHSSVFWRSRQIENREGAAEGTLTGKDGLSRPVAIRLVREGGQWKVVGVRYGGVDLTTLKSPSPVPPEAELERMVADALLGFNQAVRARDFTAFHGTLADVLQKQTTPEQLQKTFQEFIDKDADIGGVKNAKPQFAAPPAVNDKGVLAVRGHYPTRPFQVRFELEYAREQAGWKLSGIKVGLVKSGTADQ